MVPEIAIRAVGDAADAKHAEALQRAVWGMPPGEVVPVHQLITAVRWGGMLLVAYEADEPIGFCYGFVGLDAGQPVMCSHMLGVLPEHRSHGIGYALKLEQRRLARQRGLERVVWTFDPLEARNAYLNLHKLDAFAERYYVDAYGPMEDDLNKGLPSDRLLVEWRIDEARPSADRGSPRVDTADPVLNPGYTSETVPVSGGMDETAIGAERVLIAVPDDITGVKKAAPEVAMAWRMNLREAMTTALQAGYRVIDLAPTGEGLSFYVLGYRRAHR